MGIAFLMLNNSDKNFRLTTKSNWEMMMGNGKPDHTWVSKG